MNTKQKQLQHQKRRLDRRNANRNIDYDASPSESYSPLESPQSPFRILALDDDQTSFRIQGTEGEFDRICSYLGLSGPDDFAIPTAAWEASKARSYHFPSSRFVTRHNSVKLGVSESIVDGLSDAIEAQISATEKLKHENERLQLKNGSNQASIEASVGKFGEPIEDGLSDAFEAPIRVSGKLNDHNGRFQLNSGVNPAEIKARVRNIDGVRHGYHESRLSVRCTRDGGCGIKGTRPPLLAPPPAISQVVRDNISSTWDIFRSFGPQDEELCSEDGLGLTTRLSKEEDREIEEYDEGDGNIEGKSDMDRALLRHNSVVPESCWDTTNNDISFHTITMEPLYCILPNGKSKRSIKCWQKGDFLGSGSFGTVYEGFTDDGLFFAVKEVSLLDQGSQGKQSILQLEQEISLLSKFKHENIVQYLGTDKDDSKLYIFLELVTKGSLANLYQKYHLRDSQVCAYTRQILNGLNYLHRLNVVHRDIKCANILVDASGSVKLADFGLAKATKLNDIKSCKGTAFWMAPEVVNQKNRGYGLAADIWSLGCTVLEMLTCKIPYYHLEGMQALFRIGKGELPLIPSSLSIDAQDFIYKCLQVIPDDRPTAAELLDHSFVKRSLSSSLGPPSPFHNGTRGLKAFTSL